MRSKKMLAVGLAIGVLACGGDPTGTNSGDPLTTEEIQALFTEFGNAFAGVGVTASLTGTGGASLRAAATPFNVNVGVTTQCPLGGDLSLNGSFDGDINENTGEGNASIDIRWGLLDCVIANGTNTLTVNGDPEIVFKADFQFTNEVVSFNGTQKGGIRFTSSDGRMGTCAFDVAFSATISGTGSSQTQVTGTVCGQSAAGFNTGVA